MIKIMLINPPDYKMVQGAIPKELGSDRMGKYPPLGLLYIAKAAITKIPTLDIRIVDAITDKLTHDDIRRKIAGFAPDVVGLSVYTFTLIDALQVAQSVKTTVPSAKVVFGGFHPSIYPKETLLCSPYVDIAVAGEAEETFPELIGRILDKEPLEGLAGVSLKKTDGSIHLDNRIPFTKDLDGLPIIDRTIVNYRKHTCILGAQGLSTNILSSRGCPFKCQYCYVNIKQYRLRSIDNLLAEIRECIALGIHDFFFVDDLFNINKERVSAFSERIINEGLKISWSFRGRVDQINAEVLEKAKQAGCTRIHYGVESGVPEILKRICKGTDIQMVKNVIGLTKKAGIEVSSNIMIGLPGESPEETEQTIDFALALQTDYVQIAVFTPYPETPLYKEGLNAGLFPNDYWRDFALNPTEKFEPYIWGEFYTRVQIFDKLREFYRRFYLRPRFIFYYLKRSIKVASPIVVIKNAFTFITLILKKGRTVTHDRNA